MATAWKSSVASWKANGTSALPIGTVTMVEPGAQ
jgi:hypothetical protein